MQWIYWFDATAQRFIVGLRNGQGLVIGADSDWPTREQAQRRVVVLAGGDPVRLEAMP